MTTFAVTLALLLLAAVVFGVDEFFSHRRERIARKDAERRLAVANERIHAISNSAMRGHPLVRWSHPSPTPSSDRWYWLARFDGRKALFTAEAVNTAFERARLLLPAVRVVPSTEPVAKDDTPLTGGTITSH